MHMETYASGATPRPERVALYCRISLDALGEGLGVERQETECLAFAERQGWQITDRFVDNDVSATTGVTRPEFERMLAARPDRIVVWHTDRLVRKTGDLERVIDLGVPVHAVTAGHIDLSTPAGRAVARTVTAWATFEGEQKSLRQKAAHRQRAEQGRPFWGGRRPFGYNLDGTLCEDEAAALRECYRIYREGGTFAQGATYLREQGFTTTIGNGWTGSRLARLMRDPRNAGILVYGRTNDNPDGDYLGRGNWPPIVPETEWRATVERAKIMPKAATPQGDKIKSLLGGIGTCAECGEPLRQTWQQSRRADGSVAKTRIYQPACHHVSIRADWLDEQIEYAVFRMTQRPVWNLVRGQQPDEAEAAQAATDALAARKRRDALLDMFTAGDLDADSFKRAKAGLDERIATLESAATAYYRMAPVDQALGTASNVLTLWRSGDLSLQHKRETVQRMLAEITVRRRLNRNERANHGMIHVVEREATTGEPGAVFTDWPKPE